MNRTGKHGGMVMLIKGHFVVQELFRTKVYTSAIACDYCLKLGKQEPARIVVGCMGEKHFHACFDHEKLAEFDNHLHHLWIDCWYCGLKE